MANYRDILLTVDYDRTLTAPDSTIPQRNLDAIADFMAGGGAFTVNTGRSVPMAQSFLGKVRSNAPLLLYNGSAAFDPETRELSLLRPIPLDLWETVNTCAGLFPDLAVEVQGIDAHYQITRKKGWEEFCAHNHCPWALAEPGQDLNPFLKFSLYGTFHDLTVNGMFHGTAEEIARMDEAEAELRHQFGQYVEVFRAAPRIIDVHAKGVSKARAARALQKTLGKPILVCVGDAYNDLPMLLDADHAFVPGDSPLVRQFPSVCPCGDGAVADVILHEIPKL